MKLTLLFNFLLFSQLLSTGISHLLQALKDRALQTRQQISEKIPKFAFISSLNRFSCCLGALPEQPDHFLYRGQ